MILFFDTETNGKPKDYKASMRDLDNWPRVIQLAWAVYSDTGDKLDSACNLITPDGWTIPNELFWIENGYNTEKNEIEGIPMWRALEVFAKAARDCRAIVAHNIQFDYNVLGAEMLRYEVSVGRKMEQYCTMEHGTNICKLPGYRGQYKWPSLAELHQHLLGEGFENAHDAMADVEACARCYFKMIGL